METLDSKVNLIAMSKPSAITGTSTAEQLVAYTARVSNPSNQANNETAAKLLKYLIRNEHWSPLEMVHMTMEIKTTRDIARQILRHRSFSFQEFSQRYAEATDFKTREARLQDTKNRQNSIPLSDDDKLAENWNIMQAKHIKASEDLYQSALSLGIAKEQARAVLPEGNTMSTIYMAGSLRSWVHYCQLRMANGTQKEHMDVAAKCWEIINVHFPSVIEAVTDE